MWIALPSPSHSTTSDVASRPIKKTMWRPHPDRSDVHVVNPVLLDELKAKWEVTKAALKVSFSAMSSITSLSSVEQPKKAYLRAIEALQRLEMEFRAWRDFIEVSATCSGPCWSSVLFWTGGVMFVSAMPLNHPSVCQLGVLSFRTSACIPIMCIGLWQHIFSF